MSGACGSSVTCYDTNKNSINPLSPNSDQRSTSPYHATAWSSIQVTRIEVIITKDKISWFKQILPAIAMRNI